MGFFIFYPLFMSTENDRADGEVQTEDLMFEVARINDRHARSNAQRPDGTLDEGLYRQLLEETLKC